MLSTLDAGQANDNYDGLVNINANKHFEYLGGGGVMEFKSKESYKKVINYVDNLNNDCDSDKSWYFAEIYYDKMPVDFFDFVQNYEIFDYQDLLRWCVSIIEQSPSALLMLKEAIEKDWKIAIDDLNGGDYCLDIDNKILILDNNALTPAALVRSSYFRNITLVTMVKALRDIWQEKRHGGFDEQYSPDKVLLMERLRAADLEVMAILVMWELRSEGYSDIWRHIIGSEIGDMAMVFSGYLERDPRSQFNAKGLLAAFKQWFKDAARVNSCDHDTLEYLDEVLAISDVINPFGHKTPSKINIEMISCLPDKTAYLQGQGAEILGNPTYSSVDDDINQTHLFHIMHDLESVVVGNVAFRDANLARKIFPVE